MELKNFIKIFDNVIPLETLSNFLRHINTLKFEKAGIIKEGITLEDFNVRRTFNYGLSNNNKSLTDVHWFNLLGNIILNTTENYRIEKNLTELNIKGISEINILKYENTGFYTWHSDHCALIPRTMSYVLLLNNDYEGGNLCFRNPDGSGEWEIEVKPNRMIIWPSNFLYPHTVKPVTKGTRYSVVAWSI